MSSYGVWLPIGQSRYTPDAGGVDQPVFCGVCRQCCKVEQNVQMATQMAEAMARQTHAVDNYTCPSRQELWHKQAEKLTNEIKHSPSKFYSDLLQKELNQILEKREPTKTKEELAFVNLGF